MNKKIYLPAGFWIRLLSRLIDFLLIAILSYGLLFAVMVRTDNQWVFRDTWLFYLWSFFSIMLVIFFMVLIPIWTKGWSLGQKICKIKVISTNNHLYKAILYREFTFAFGWAFIMLVVTIIINHTLIFQISMLPNKNPPKLTQWEKTRIAVVGSVSSLIIFIQMFMAITIIPHKNKRGLHDRAAHALVIKPERYHIITPEVDRSELLKPKKINNIKIEWVE